MNTEVLEHYRKRLIEIERDVLSTVIAVEHEIEMVEDVDEVELMERVQTEVLAETLQDFDDFERAHIDDVEAALDRVDDRSYGMCVDCGREIPRARLDSVPWAQRCEADQERFERNEQRAPKPRH